MCKLLATENCQIKQLFLIPFKIIRTLMSEKYLSNCQLSLKLSDVANETYQPAVIMQRLLSVVNHTYQKASKLSDEASPIIVCCKQNHQKACSYYHRYNQKI